MSKREFTIEHRRKLSEVRRGKKHPWAMTGKTIKCEICNKEVYIEKHRLHKAKFCSYKCYWISKKDKDTWIAEKNKEDYPQLSNSGTKKGHTPWNKGKQIPDTQCRMGGITRKSWYKKFCKYKRKFLEHKAGKLTLKTIQLVYEDNIKKYGTLTCYLCVKPIKFGKDNLEHKTPLIRGGTNEYHNLAIACKMCNCKKFTKTEEEYRKLIN